MGGYRAPFSRREFVLSNFINKAEIATILTNYFSKFIIGNNNIPFAFLKELGALVIGAFTFLINKS